MDITCETTVLQGPPEVLPSRRRRPHVRQVHLQCRLSEPELRRLGLTENLLYESVVNS